MDYPSFTIGFFVFPLVAVALIALWIAYILWHDGRQENQQAQAKLEQRVSEPMPGTFGKRDHASAVAVIVQVDALLKRLDDAELDEVIAEMQMRGW